jgi:hypothetical protein
MTNSLLRYLRFRREVILAEAALLEEYIAHAERAANGPDENLLAFNPAWKRGARLTALGRYALEEAFERGMRQSEVARLFQISMTRTHGLHQKWLAARRTQTIQAK